MKNSLLAALVCCGFTQLSIAASTDIEVGASHADLTGAHASWESAYLHAAHRFSPRRVVYGTIEQSKRFDLRDDVALIGAYIPVTDAWTAVVEAAGSETHHIRPKGSFLVQLEGSLKNGWGVQGGFRRTEYTTSRTSLTTFTVERYWDVYRAAYTLYAGRPDGGGTAISHSVGFNRYYGDRNYVGVVFVDGKEAENVLGAGVVTTEIRGVSLVGRHWFTPNWGLSVEATYHEQGDFYERRGLSVGLRRVF